MQKVAIRALAALFVLALQPVGQAVAQDGVAGNTILIGRSAGMTGGLAARAKPATEAVNAYFDAVNAAGGINGRQIKLVNLDDGNEAKRAADNSRKLILEDKVLTLFGQTGTPQAQAVVPLLSEYQVPMVGTTAGADSLRKPNKYLFHVKASYGQEIIKMAEHMKTTGISRVAVAYTDDGTGREGRQLAEVALQGQGLKSVGDIMYKAGEAKGAVDKLAKLEAQAVILVTLAGPGAEFYRELVKLPVRPQVFTWSIMAVEAIYKEVGEKAYGLVVSQIVPSPNDRSIAIVREYQDVIKKAGLTEPNYSGLEAYINARVLVEGIRRAGKTLTRASLITALEGIKNYDLGGDFVNFTDDHVGRRYVDLTIVGRDGRFLR